jgi:hypothetical protein
VTPIAAAAAAAAAAIRTRGGWDMGLSSGGCAYVVRLPAAVHDKTNIL